MSIRSLREIAYSGKTLLDNEFGQKNRLGNLPHGHMRIDNVLFCPLIIDGKTLGLLGLANKNGGFTGEDEKLALGFGKLVARALFNSQRLEQLQIGINNYSILAETAGDAIIACSIEGKIVFANKSSEVIFDYSPDELVGSTLLSILPNADQKLIEMANQLNLPDAVSKTFITTGLRKDGRSIPLEISLGAWFDGRDSRCLAIIREISQRKREEEQQRYSLFEKFPDIIFFVDQEGRIVQSNNKGLEVYGYSKQEINSMHISNLFQAGIACMSSNTYETYHKKKNGEVFPVVTRCQEAIFADKSLTLFHIRDITERYQSQKLLQETQKKVYLAERLAALGTMAAGIAHEINQPLNTIRLAIDGILFLHRNNRTLYFTEIIEILSCISSELKGINDIIKNIRDLALKESCVKFVPCHLSQIITQVVDGIKPQAERYRIGITKSLAPTPTIQAHPTRLEQIIKNLVLNAVDALEPLEKDNKEIEIKLYVEQQTVILEVSDNATGIKEDVKRKIFDPFFTTKETDEGMGIGLSLVHSFVVSTGGSLDVFNNNKGGATFHIAFPTGDFSLQSTIGNY